MSAFLTRFFHIKSQAFSCFPNFIKLCSKTIYFILAVATLGADENSLLNDLNFTGFLFESLVTNELRVYAQANDAKVYHYRDSSGLEVDSIVQKHNGDWCAFEIKLAS